jgi:hypothetical protein
MTQNFEIDGTLNTDRLINLAAWKLKLRNQAIEEGKHDYAAYYERQMKIYDKAADYIALQAMLTTKQLLAIPEINTTIGILALPMNSESFNADLIEAEEATIIEHNVGTKAHKEIVRGKLNSIGVKKQVQEFKNKIATTAERLEVEGFDLFALNEQQETKLRLKMKFERELSPEDEKRLFAKEIRETILDYLSKGARNEAFDLLKNYALRNQNYPDFEIHKLLEALKDKYKVKEPKTNPHINPLYIDNFKEKWLSVRYYSKKQQGETEKDIEETVLGFYDPDNKDGIISKEGKVICGVEQIHRFRPATQKEIEEIEKLIDKL